MASHPNGLYYGRQPDKHGFYYENPVTTRPTRCAGAVESVSPVVSGRRYTENKDED